MLLVLFDDEWWRNYVPNPDGEDRDGLSVEGIAAFIGINLGVPEEVSEIAAIRRERGRFDPAIGIYVDRETGEPL